MFTGTITIASDQTRGTAQGTMRITNVDTGDSVEFYCTARAAINAKGDDAGCTHTVQASLSEGSTWSMTCEWRGDTTSRNPSTSCAASIVPYGEWG